MLYTISIHVHGVFFHGNAIGYSDIRILELGLSRLGAEPAPKALNGLGRFGMWDVLRCAEMCWAFWAFWALSMVWPLHMAVYGYDALHSFVSPNQVTCIAWDDMFVETLLMSWWVFFDTFLRLRTWVTYLTRVCSVHCSFLTIHMPCVTLACVTWMQFTL